MRCSASAPAAARRCSLRLLLPACGSNTPSAGDAVRAAIQVTVDPTPVPPSQNALTGAVSVGYRCDHPGAERPGRRDPVRERAGLRPRDRAARTSLTYFDGADLIVFVGSKKIDPAGHARGAPDDELRAARLPRERPARGQRPDEGRSRQPDQPVDPRQGRTASARAVTGLPEAGGAAAAGVARGWDPAAPDVAPRAPRDRRARPRGLRLPRLPARDRPAPVAGAAARAHGLRRLPVPVLLGLRRQPAARVARPAARPWAADGRGACARTLASTSAPSISAT